MSTPALVSLVHLGCARNLIDSELMLGRMAEEGLVVTDDIRKVLGREPRDFAEYARDTAQTGVWNPVEEGAHGGRRERAVTG